MPYFMGVRVQTNHFKQFIDIGANLTDSMFSGVYNGKTYHANDLETVLTRTFDSYLDKVIITSGCLKDVNSALRLCSTNENLYTTVGCHPTRCNEFLEDPDEYYQNLHNLIHCNPRKVVAVGEIGLDYDRLQFCAKDVQLKYFNRQLELAVDFGLPLFLHCRNAHNDFIDVLYEAFGTYGKMKGVVHSYDGSLEDAERLIGLGFKIGINGCSLRTEQSLEVVKNLPLGSLMIETDAPYCGIKTTHPSYKYVKTVFESKKKEKYEMGFLCKDRNEPINIIQVFEVLCGIRNEEEQVILETLHKNTMSLFFK